MGTLYLLWMVFWLVVVADARGVTAAGSAWIGGSVLGSPLPSGGIVDRANRGSVPARAVTVAKRSLIGSRQPATTRTNRARFRMAEPSSACGGRRVVVVGAGVIGASTAYYLAREGCAPVLVEKCGVACHSSGKAGGFLGKSWSDGSPVGPLQRASFDLHQELASELGTDIGYRRLRAITAGLGEQAVEGTSYDGTSGPARLLGDEEDVAQVTPKLLTEALVAAAQDHGAEVRFAQVTGVELDDDRVTGVHTSTGLVPCDAVVFAMGPWTSQVAAWLGPSGGKGVPSQTVAQKYTSVVLDKVLEPTAVFLNSPHGVEIYPRAKETYATGSPVMGVPLPDDPLAIEPEPERARMVVAEAVRVASALAAVEPVRTTACFLPGSDDGMPVIGALPAVPNAYLACGHTCWGILNAPATGKALAALIARGVSDEVVDLKPFAPDESRSWRSRLLR